MVVTIDDSTGFSIMDCQIPEKKSATCCQIPDHHSGMPWNHETTLCHACGIVSVKNEQIDSQI